MKAFFPLSAMASSLAGMIVSLVLYAGVGALTGWIFSAVKDIWVIGMLAEMVCTVIWVYLVVGVVVSVVTYIKNRD